MNQEWREWSREKLEHEYAPSEWAKQPYLEYAQIFRDGSDLARSALGSKLVVSSYGPRSRNIIAWSPPTFRDGIFVWIHGGYWQESSIDEALLGADDLVSQGFGFAAIEYPLAPEITVAGIIEECLAALIWLRHQLPNAEFVIGGHSAGAHLALIIAKRFAASGLVLVSGVYDLRPLVPTSVNDPLFLTDSGAWELSPLSSGFPDRIKAEILVGGEESPSFIAQSKAAHDYLLANGCQVACRVIDGRDHFDIITEREHITSFFELVTS